MRKILLFLAPFCLWVFLFRDFIAGVIPFNMDTNTIYAVAKYYFNNLLNGTVPLWEPYVCFGRPFYAIAICNLFNPVTQLVLLFKSLGFNYQQAFSGYIVVYFFIGALGFYDLAKQIFNDKRLAYVGYVALIFSGIGASIFNQLTLLEIFVPSVWLFSFLIRFTQKPHLGHFWGVAFSVMILLISYLPFYLATFFIFFVALMAVLFGQQLGMFVTVMGRFLWRHKVHAFLALLGLLAAAMPLLAYKAIDASHEAVSPARHCANADHLACYNNTMNDAGGMSYEETSRSGGLGERVDLGSMLSHLDKITYGSDHFFFVPFVMCLLIALGVFTRARPIVWLLGLLGLCVSLVAMADAGPWHKVLYQALFFVKYFRNLFFFEVFLMPLLILLALSQVDALRRIALGSWSTRKAMMVGVVVMHGIAGFFLSRFNGIIPAMWWTLGASAVYWVVYFTGWRHAHARGWMALLALIVMVQPVAVFRAYAHNAQEFKITLPNAHTIAHFSWVRPVKPPQQEGRIYQFVPYENFWYAMNMTDSSGYIGYSESATRWAFHLEQWIGDQNLFAYARHKFIVYDRTQQSDDTPQSLARAMPTLLNGDNVAFIAQGQSQGHGTDEAKAMRFDGPTRNFQLNHFDANAVIVTTDFPKPKFLVYNDAYTQHWKVKVNGQYQELVRANFAFKGVWVPAGKAVVEFRYEPPLGHGWVYPLITIILILIGIYTCWVNYVFAIKRSNA